MFVVRLRREPREVAETVPEWRGVIEHLRSGERRYVRAIADIVPFIARFLDGDGSAVPAQGKGWLAKWRRS